ncbi:GIY-YIG nuclease family protein [Arsenophonus nasoniae]|uniref:GIY-YIG nuclease family protein n=1 Tax=Arsenophonus nasoniae TaxID=638 RepID=UPI00387A3625
MQYSNVVAQSSINSLEMVEYINAVAESANKQKSIAELDCHLEIIERLMISTQNKYYSICRAVYCHINSIIYEKTLDSLHSDSESGVYLIEFSDGLVKIGMTFTNFEKRLRAAKNQNASSIIRYEFIPCNNPSKLESSLHRNVSHARSHGEFFKIDFDDCLRIAKVWAGKYQPQIKTK